MVLLTVPQSGKVSAMSDINDVKMVSANLLGENTDLSCGSRDPRARQSNILSATIRLASKVGFENITLKMLSDEAQVSVQTIYNLIGGRHEVILKAIGRRTSHMFEISKINSEYPSPFLKFCDEQYECFSQYPDLYRSSVNFVFDNGLINNFMNKMAIRIIDDCVIDLVRQNRVRSFFDRSKFSHMICTVNFDAALKWARDECSTTEYRSMVTHNNLCIILGSLKEQAAAPIEAWAAQHPAINARR